MRSLGRPNREQVVTTRGDILTTLQALDLSNGQIFTDILARGAAEPARIEDPRPRPTSWPTRSTCRRWAAGPRPTSWRRPASCVGSPPTPEGLADLLWVVFMLPEFQLIR